MYSTKSAVVLFVGLIAEMPKILKKQLKFKCLEVLCNTVHRQDKWLDHCKKKHIYKYKNKIDIKYKVIEEKIGDGPWTKWTGEDNSQCTEFER